jgi:predicted nucleotidyltransferase
MEFESAVQSLSDAGVEFVIVGGVAALIHGSSQVTFDLDICYSRARSNLKRLAQALAPAKPRPRGFPADLPFIWDEATLRNATVLTLQTDLGDIDLLAEVAGVGTFESVKEHSVVIQAFGREVQVLDLRSLIAAKRAANRLKDRLTLPELEALLEAIEDN